MEALAAGGPFVNLTAVRQSLGGKFILDTTSSVVLVLYRPSVDVADGNWTSSLGGGDLYAAINEETFDDANYIQSGTNPSGDVANIRFESALTPPVMTGHTIRYRIKGASNVAMTVDLLSNVTVIKTWTHNPVASTYTTYEQTLTTGEAATIADYTNLRLRFTAG